MRPNKNQLFFTTLAIISATTAALLKNTEPHSTIILTILTITLFILTYVYRSKAPPYKKTTITPEIMPPKTTQIKPTYPTPIPTRNFDEKISTIIDQALTTATITTDLTIEVPLTQEINYHGKKVQVKGNLKMQINNNQQQTSTPTENNPQQTTERSIDE